MSPNAPVNPRATSPDAGAPVADAPATPQPTTTDDPQQVTIFGRASVGAADHGGRNANLFLYNPISQFGDWIGFGVAGGALYDLNRGNFRVRLGGDLVYNRTNGGENTSGSNINIFGIAPRLELDWRRAWGRGPVAGPSRFGIEWALGYGFGTTTVDGGFQLHNQSGFAMIPRADLNLINVRLGSVEMGLDFYVQNPTVYGSQHNSGFLELGGALTFRGAIEPAPTVVVGDACTTDRRAEVVQRIHQLQTESADLRNENTANASFLEGIRTQLEGQGVTAEELRNSLRHGLELHLASLQTGDTALPRAEVVEHLRRLYANYLRSRTTDPVTDAEARMAEARQIFPDDFDPSTEANRTVAARAVFPDDMDPYAYREVEGVDVPDPLPQGCDALDALRTRLEDERADLREQHGLLDGLVRMGLVRLGVPAAAQPHLIRAITRLSEIHFITSRPMGAPDAVAVASADIAPINAAAEEWGRTHSGQVRPQPELNQLFRSIFPPTRGAPGTPEAGQEVVPALDVVRGIAETLRSPDMRGAHFYIVGNTDTRGDPDMNRRLSLRRAQAVRDALIFYGVDPAMVTPLGHGEDRPVYYFDQRRGATDHGHADPHAMSQVEVTALRQAGITNRAGHPDLDDETRGRQSTNRRIEMFVCLPNSHDEVCRALDAEINPTPPAGAADAGVTGHADAPVQTVTSDAGAPPARGQRGGPTGDAGAPPPPADAGAPTDRRDE